MLTVLAACLLLKNATVIDPSAGTVRAGDVRIGTPPCVTRDVTGKYVVPGFVDAHAHLFLRNWDEHGNLERAWDRETTLRMLRLFLAFGVTTIRDPGAETEAAVQLRRMVRDRRVIGPRIVTAGRIINAGSLDSEPFVQLRSADAIRREIRWQALAGVDLIKIYASLPPDLVQVAIEEAHAQHLPIVGHMQRTSWTIAARMGIDGVEHAADWSEDHLPSDKRAAYDNSMFGRVYWLNNIDPSSIREMIAALVEHHVTVDPTLMAIRTKFFDHTHNPDLALVPDVMRTSWAHGDFTKDWTQDQFRQAQAAWPILLRLTKQMFEAGVPMIAGTDSPTPWIVPGASFHDEMLLLHDAGLPNMAILKMATTNTGALDYVVLSKNPVEDIRNTRSIVTVIHDGIEYDPAKLLHESSQ